MNIKKLFICAMIVLLCVFTPGRRLVAQPYRSDATHVIQFHPQQVPRDIPGDWHFALRIPPGKVEYELAVWRKEEGGWHQVSLEPSNDLENNIEPSVTVDPGNAGNQS